MRGLTTRRARPVSPALRPDAMRSAARSEVANRSSASAMSNCSTAQEAEFAKLRRFPESRRSDQTQRMPDGALPNSSSGCSERPLPRRATKVPQPNRFCLGVLSRLTSLRSGDTRGGSETTDLGENFVLLHFVFGQVEPSQPVLNADKGSGFDIYCRMSFSFN